MVMVQGSSCRAQAKIAHKADDGPPPPLPAELYLCLRAQSSNKTMEWCTIESDPAVFTELIEKIGVKTPLEADEVVDIDGLASIEGCRGFILLFKYDKDTMAPTSRDASVGSADPSLFFAKQVSCQICCSQIPRIALASNDRALPEEHFGFSTH